MLNTIILAGLLATQAPADPKPAPAAPLSQIETLALETLEARDETVREKEENAKLSRSLLEAHARQWKAVVEASRPGHLWDWSKRQFVPKPEPVKAPVKAPTPPVEK